jgi:hypothetical protein
MRDLGVCQKPPSTVLEKQISCYSKEGKSTKLIKKKKIQLESEGGRREHTEQPEVLTRTAIDRYISALHRADLHFAPGEISRN